MTQSKPYTDDRIKCKNCGENDTDWYTNQTLVDDSLTSSVVLCGHCGKPRKDTIHGGNTA
jgi:DNA-directed RNA polymerase subunit M/transcription elongation factor TFIIS